MQVIYICAALRRSFPVCRPFQVQSVGHLCSILLHFKIGTSNLVGMLIIGCPSLSMTNHLWKGRGQGHVTNFRILHPTARAAQLSCIASCDSWCLLRVDWLVVMPAARWLVERLSQDSIEVLLSYLTNLASAVREILKGCKFLKLVTWPWPRPFQGQVVIGRLGHAMINLYPPNLKSLSSAVTEIWNALKMHQMGVVWGG